MVRLALCHVVGNRRGPGLYQPKISALQEQTHTGSGIDCCYRADSIRIFAVPILYAVGFRIVSNLWPYLVEMDARSM